MHQNIGQVVLPLVRKRADGLVQPLGTCFAVSAKKFATAAHVTGPADTGLAAVIGRVKSLLDYQDTTDTSVNLIDLKMTAYDPVRDISILEFTDVGSLAQFSYALDGTDSISTGTPVVTLGFPHADTGRLVLTQQASMVGARVLLGTSGVKSKHVVLNTQTRPGQSGGPVLSPDGMRVHAMVLGGYVQPGGSGISLAGIDPHTLHQTTHAVSAEYIKAML
jgi:S1-C subfamily serine protease